MHDSTIKPERLSKFHFIVTQEKEKRATSTNKSRQKRLISIKKFLSHCTQACGTNLTKATLVLWEEKERVEGKSPINKVLTTTVQLFSKCTITQPRKIKFDLIPGN